MGEGGAAIDIFATLALAIAFIPLALLPVVQTDLLIIAVSVLPVVAFQGEGTVANLLKIAVVGYMAAALALVHLNADHQPRPLRRPTTNGLVVSAAFAAVAIFVSTASGIAAGNTPTNALRDLLGLLLIIAAPFVGLRLGRISTRARIESLLLICGLYSALSYWLYWASIRRLVPASLGRLGLASWTLPLAAILLFLHPTRRSTVHRVGSFACVALLVFSSSRTALIPSAVIMLAVIARVANFRRAQEIGASRFGGLARPILIVLTLGVGVSAYLQIPLAPLLGRTVSAVNLFSDRGDDQSYIERSAQTAQGWNALRDNPVFGVGPGHVFEWPSAIRVQRSFVLEAPSSLLADLGIVGVVPLVFFLAYIWRFYRRRPDCDPATTSTIFWVLIAVWAYFAVSSPFDDKGLFVAIILLFAHVSAAPLAPVTSTTVRVDTAERPEVHIHGKPASF